MAGLISDDKHVNIACRHQGASAWQTPGRSQSPVWEFYLSAILGTSRRPTSSPTPRLYRTGVMADRWCWRVSCNKSAGYLHYAQRHVRVCVSRRVPYPHANFVCGVTASSEAVDLWVVNVYFQKITRGAVRVVQILGLGIQPACVGHVWHVVGRVDPCNDEKSLGAKCGAPSGLSARPEASISGAPLTDRISPGSVRPTRVAVLVLVPGPASRPAPYPSGRKTALTASGGTLCAPSSGQQSVSNGRAPILSESNVQ